MRTRTALITLAFLIASVLPAMPAPFTEETLRAVVKIRSIVPKDARTAATLGTEREGSGVVIDKEGTVLTIGYLIAEADSIEVTGPEGKVLAATLLGYDHATGFGLVRTEKPFDVEPLALGQSKEIKEGETLLAAGQGGADATTVVRVISRREFAGYWEYVLESPLITAPAFLNYGGAALLGPEGKLLGIGSLFTQIVVPGIGAVGANLFVPVDLLSPILADLKTRGRSSTPSRPWLGINADEAHGRIFLSQITAEGPAEQAGLQKGDLVLTVAGKPVEGLADFYRKVWALGSAGTEVPLGILRGIQIREITVRSGDRHQFLILKPRKT
jgi:S1-C subfamily serine protease